MPELWCSGAACDTLAQRMATPGSCPREAFARTRVCTQTWVATILIFPHKMTSSRQSGPLVASTLAPQWQYELARRNLVMGLVQVWSARFPCLECPGPRWPYQPPTRHIRATGAPDSRAGLIQPRCRQGANVAVLSAAPSFRLRCQRCDGLHSRAYHCRLFRNPIAYFAIGVCSRRRTGCANTKTLKERAVDSGTMDRPAIFVANVNAEGQCTTVENEEVNFPRPGPDTEGSLSEPGFWCAGPPTFAGSGGDPPQAIALSNTPTASTALTRVTYSRTPIETGAISGVVADPAFGVNIINNLDSSIHAWSVARKPGAERVIDARGGAYFEAWRAREDEGGISIKMALEASQESVLQFEYSLQSSIVYWDVSFIDMDRESNFIMGGITVTTSDPTCRGLTCLPQDKNRNQVYLEPDDNYAIRGCPMQTNVTLSIGSRPGKRAWA